MESENKYHSHVKQQEKRHRSWHLAFTWNEPFLSLGNFRGEPQHLQGLGPPRCSSPKQTCSISSVHRCALQTAFELGTENTWLPHLSFLETIF